jgi:predicted NAD/FAD-dependent oxidoreductase
MLDCVIVGAGVSGLAAARTLQSKGLQLAVVDKGRGVGGRMATRRIAGGRADHGAQAFAARTPEFRAIVSPWLMLGIAAEWSAPPAGPFGCVSAPHDHPLLRGAAGMSDVPKALAAGLPVSLGWTAESLTTLPGGWRVTSAGGDVIDCRAVLLTPPVPQSLALLDRSGVALEPATRGELDRVAYAPCFAVILALSGESGVPAPGGLAVGEGPLAWIADNRLKGVSPDVTTLTLLATTAYSADHFDEDQGQIGAELLASARPWIGDAAATEVQVHRWRYAIPTTRHPRHHVIIRAGEGVLAFAGDAFGDPNIEGAALSGLSVAEALGMELGR